MSFMPSLRGKNELNLKYAYHHSCLVSDYTVFMHTISLCTCQLIAEQECVHHLKLCSGRLETSIMHIALCIKHTLWLPTMEVQDAP